MVNNYGQQKLKDILLKETSVKFDTTKEFNLKK